MRCILPNISPDKYKSNSIHKDKQDLKHIVIDHYFSERYEYTLVFLIIVAQALISTQGIKIGLFVYYIKNYFLFNDFLKNSPKELKPMGYYILGTHKYLCTMQAAFLFII